MQDVQEEAQEDVRMRLRKRDRREQILLELKLRPHLRISELADRFGVSTETVRRDFDALADKGLIDRAHGGASRPQAGHYPTLDERQRDQARERERIGKCAAALVVPGETVMVTVPVQRSSRMVSVSTRTHAACERPIGSDAAAAPPGG
ncbi:MAG: DeoR/GlpR transcriptional regulator [Microthrixaceae bacterium]|nr:DeoR/GlpR transcriptional regulator [Microthrixaceae bacterium]